MTVKTAAGQLRSNRTTARRQPPTRTCSEHGVAHDLLGQGADEHGRRLVAGAAVHARALRQLQQRRQQLGSQVWPLCPLVLGAPVRRRGLHLSAHAREEWRI